MSGMHQKILHFIKYHNAFTIIFVVMFLGFGVSLAVSPEVRESIYNSSEITVAIDNRLILDTNLDGFNFNPVVTAITEDEINYYVIYAYRTLVIEDGVWQNKELTKTLEVSKEALDGKDLGLYVAGQLAENINYESDYLKRVQVLEKEKGETPKIVAVAYSGLIGKLLNPKEKIIEGYNPIIPEETPTPIPEEFSQSGEDATVGQATSESAIVSPEASLPNFITPLPPNFTEAGSSASPTVEPPQSGADATAAGQASPSSSPEVTPVPSFSEEGAIGQAPLTSPSSEPVPASSSATPSPSFEPSATPEASQSTAPTPEPTFTPTPEPTSTTSPTGSVSPAPSLSTTPEPTPLETIIP